MARKKKKRLGLIKFLFLLALVGVALTNVQVIFVGFFDPPFTSMMLWKWATQGGSLFPSTIKDNWRPLHEISPFLRKAILAGEDQRFLTHWGFDFIELNEAIHDLFQNKGMRGASTITMQVARTVFLWTGRSWIRKLLEAYYTLLIELYWPKRRILEVYLNTVDWGSGIIGAESAARTYFNKSSGAISKSEAAALAAILPSPHRWSPLRPNLQVLMRQRRILKNMEKMPLISFSTMDIFGSHGPVANSLS